MLCLALFWTSKEELVRNVKLKGNPVCSDHEMMEFDILRAVRVGYSELSTCNFGKADFGLFRDLLGRVLWNKALERGERKLADNQLSLPARSGAMQPSEGEIGKKFPGGLHGWGRSTLTNQTHKGSLQRWKQGQVACEEYREVIPVNIMFGKTYNKCMQSLSYRHQPLM